MNKSYVAAFVMAAAISGSIPAYAFVPIEIPTTVFSVDKLFRCKDARISVNRINSTTVRVTASACGISTTSGNFTSVGGEPTFPVITQIFTYGDAMCHGTGAFAEFAEGTIIRIRVEYPAYGRPAETLTCS